MTRISDLAWLAGFIEADGSFVKKRIFLYQSGNGGPPRVLLEAIKIMKKLGLNPRIKCRGRRGRVNKQGVRHLSDAYVVWVKGNDAKRLAPMIYPYLKGRKREICQERHHIMTLEQWI